MVVLVAVVLSAIIGLPIVAIFAISSWNSTNTLSKAAPIWVHPLRSEDTIRTGVDVVLSWTVVPPILAPNWSGVVTAAGQIPPGGLHSGDSIASVDGIVRLAVHTVSPFHRSLSADDSGPDVAMFNSFLAQRGLDARDDDYFGYATLRGLRGFAASIGVPNPDTVSFFDPSWLVYLPAESEGAPNSVLALELGAPAPAAGSKLVAPTLHLAGGVLTAPGAVVPNSSGTTADADLTRPISPIVPKSQVIRPPPDAKLQYSSVALPLDDLGALRPEALATLAGMISPGDKSVKAVTVAQAPPGSVLVPSAAIFATSDSKLCVVRRGPDGVQSIAVEILLNSDGTSLVTGKLSVTDEVEIAPSADERRCD